MNLTEDQISVALSNMDKFGGSFIQSLAVCYRKADPGNKDILLKSFNKIFSNVFETRKYAKL